MAITDFPDSATRAAIAAHRFGLGEPSLAALQSDPQGWLLAQIGPADAPRGEGLLSTREALDYIAAERERRERAKNPPPGMTAAQVLAGRYREITQADARSRLITAATTTRPFAERLQLFWCNHFTVSLAKGSTRGLVGAFEREAIRPHIAGSFETLLTASTTHPAMLRYLDNVQSAGANSRVAQRQARRAAGVAANSATNSANAAKADPPRVLGINENLAREVLELHTLGAESGRNGPDGGYGQADVTAFANVLTGWRIGAQGKDLAQPFDANWHEPGAKTVLGRRYPEGPDALRQVLHDLAHHPATARFIATKLARHFVADTPSPALVDRLTLAYLRNDAQLAAVYREVIKSPEAWSPQPAKLKTPEEFVISSVRMLGLGDRAFERAVGSDIASNPANAIGSLGQRIQAAPSPAGWSDRAEDWLGPDAVWKRVEWSTRVADRLGRNIDARAVAAQSLGPLIGADTQRQIERAADGPQALALLLMAPEFQRR